MLPTCGADSETGFTALLAECGDYSELRAMGSEHTGPIFGRDARGSCVPAERDAYALYRSLGAPVDPAEFPRLEVGVE